MIELVIPSNLGYGKRGAGGVIPGDATLHVLVELLDVRSFVGGTRPSMAVVDGVTWSECSTRQARAGDPARAVFFGPPAAAVRRPGRNDVQNVSVGRDFREVIKAEHRSAIVST